jgi:hypothetical protein
MTTSLTDPFMTPLRFREAAVLAMSQAFARTEMIVEK